MSATGTTDTPLATEWQFWLITVSQSEKGVSYQIESICSVNTVRNFYKYYKALPRASTIPFSEGISIAFFRQKIRPAWEDEANKDAGIYMFELCDRDLDETWFELLLACIGGDLGGDADANGQLINGIVLSKRAGKIRCEVWHSRAQKIQHVLRYLSERAVDGVVFKTVRELANR